MELERIRVKYEALASSLSERSRRLWCATEAMDIGWGGMSLVSRATGISQLTIWRGTQELKSGEVLESGRIRRPGGGRKKVAEKDSTLRQDIESLVEPTVSGNPECPLLWTYKSVRKLAVELGAMGHDISFRTVADVLRDAGYTLQSNRKAQEGRGHPDRDAQFGTSTGRSWPFNARRQPVISVDTKKKELVGNFKNAGREWRPKGSPETVQVHDFLDQGERQGHPLRGLRPRPQRRLGERGHRSRHRQLRRADHPPLVADDGTAALSQGPIPADHRRQRRQQRRPVAPVEVGTPAVGRRDGLDYRPSVTSRRAPASGTRSSIGCSRTSARTGAGGR